MTVARTARGIGLRLVVLLVGVALVGIWILSLAFKIAGAFIHLFLWLGLILVVAGVVALLVHKIRRR